MTTRNAGPSLKVAVALMTGTSFLVPAVGLVTAPLLARALSPDGRGELAAALGPATLMLAVATFGLPEALTFRLAKRPGDTRIALMWASAITLLLGGLTVALIWVSLPYLADGDDQLARLMLLAAAVTVPCLLVNVFRGAASAHQLWGRIAMERVIVTLWRLVWFVGLFVSERLTVLTAMLVIVSAPFVGALAYTVRKRVTDAVAGPPSSSGSHNSAEPILKPLLTFGAQVWFGSVAGMLLARVSQLFMVPLSSSRDLGLFSVAITIADVPLLVAFAVQSAVFGVNSRTPDSSQITITSRLTLLVGMIGCSGLAAVLPFAIVPLFGPEFADALVPTLLLILSALISIPGLMAATGLAAWGRPGLRSAGLAFTLAANAGAFFVLVPLYGVTGACYAGLFSTVLMDAFMVASARRVMMVRARDFWLIGPRDVGRLWSEFRGVRSRVLTRARR